MQIAASSTAVSSTANLTEQTRNPDLPDLPNPPGSAASGSTSAGVYPDRPMQSTASRLQRSFSAPALYMSTKFQLKTSVMELPTELLEVVLRHSITPGDVRESARQLSTLSKLTKQFQSDFTNVLRSADDDMAAASRVAMSNSLTHLAANTSLGDMALTNAVTRVLENKVHVGINLSAMDHHRRDLVLDQILTKNDVQTLHIDAPDLPEHQRALLKKFNTLHENNASLKDFYLDFALNGLSFDDLHGLAQLTKLTVLNLQGNTIAANDAGGPELAAALRPLINLKSLNASNNRLGDEGVPALSSLTQLSRLDISSNGIGAGGARSLATLPDLTVLNIQVNELGAGGATALADLTNLKDLNAGNNALGDHGVTTLSSLTQLIRLDISHNGISAAGVLALAQLTQLTELNIRSNQLRNAGAAALLSMPLLKRLQIQDNQITHYAAITALQHMPNMVSVGHDVLVPPVANPAVGLTAVRRQLF